MNKKRQILVAGMGTSPAVLTNAVWALAHQKKPIVPDEIGREIAAMIDLWKTIYTEKEN